MGESFYVACLCVVSLVAGCWWTYYLMRQRDGGIERVIGAQAGIIDGLSKITGDFCKELQTVQRQAIDRVASVKTEVIQVPMGSVSNKPEVGNAVDDLDAEIRADKARKDHLQRLIDQGVVLDDPSGV